MISHMNSVLAQIKEAIEGDRAPLEEKTSHLDGVPGESGAVNIGSAGDEFEKYIGDIVAAIMVEYDLKHDPAFACVQEAIGQLISEGALFEVPDDSDLAGLALWMARAAGLGLGARAMSLASTKEPSAKSKYKAPAGQ
jgi:hypothetical protein